MTKEKLNKGIMLDRAIKETEEEIKNIVSASNLCYKIERRDPAAKRLILMVPDGNRDMPIQITPQAAVEALGFDLRKLNEKQERMEKEFKEL